MCTKREFAELRDRIADVEKMNIAQTEQIKTLFTTTAELKESLHESYKLVKGLLWFGGVVLILAVLALIFGALGRDGFNAVTRAAPGITEVVR